MHRPKTIKSCSVLWHIRVAPSDLLLQVINLYYIVKKHTNHLWTSYPSTTLSLTQLLFLWISTLKDPMGPPTCALTRIYNNSENAVQLESPLLIVTVKLILLLNSMCYVEVLKQSNLSATIHLIRQKQAVNITTPDASLEFKGFFSIQHISLTFT